MALTPAAAEAQERGQALGAPPADRGSRPEGGGRGGLEGGFGLALGPSLLLTPETDQALGAILNVRLAVTLMGRRFGGALVPIQARMGIVSGWRAFSARAGPRLRLTEPGSRRQLLLGYDAGILSLGEKKEDLIECGEYFRCVTDPVTLVGHALSLTFTRRRPGRRNPAMGVVFEVVGHARERSWLLHLSYTLTLWHRA